jgi:hypothetical protein
MPHSASSRVIGIGQRQEVGLVVKPVSRQLAPAFLDRLAEDLVIVGWLVSVTAHAEVRDLYLQLAGKFLFWTGWTVLMVGAS